jgi:pyruvate kinase
MRRLRRIKILATLGPASSDSAMIRKLFEAGADVFRINMSHTDHANLAKLVASVRAVEAEQGRPISILVDLQGPKLRLGRIPGGERELEIGARVTLVRAETSADAAELPIPHPEIFAALKPGANLLIDDGKILPDRLKSELITLPELVSAALHGFLSERP